MNSNTTNNHIRLPSIITPFSQQQQQQQQQQQYITSPTTSNVTPFTHNTPYIITREIPYQSTAFQSSNTGSTTATSWTPSHNKSFSLDSKTSLNYSTSHNHHGKSKSLTLNNFKINYPIQKMPMDKLSQLPFDEVNKIPQLMDILTKKYSTAIDSRSFITVYEYQIDNNWIIWDYHTGLVHLTGLWKSIGNKKADIVKLIDSSPELADVVKRVRGGFLKIQGTWIPYDIARKLATKFCYDIRFQLIPLFGYQFIDDCLRPNENGFGLLRLDNSSNSKPSKRKNKLLQNHQQHHQQQQQQQHEPLTPYYYYPQQQQLPTPTSSSTTASFRSYPFQVPPPPPQQQQQQQQQQTTLLSPLEMYASSDQLYNSLPKLHTFTNNASNVYSASKNLQMNTDQDSISPKSSISSGSCSILPPSSLLKKNPKKVHKKLHSTSSINLNTVLEAAKRLDDDDDEDDQLLENYKYHIKEENSPQYFGYDKSVIDLASSLMSVSHSWRNHQIRRQESTGENETKIEDDTKLRKSKMDISGLLT